ncbi:MAG TPA: hypothetical protein RMG48_20810 [Myxococcales bacterium LLY-WYZ-16_1]|nr:hypothetical protein [Myxococcales bacterium LLY-WYZ-16_1]
MMSWPSVVQFDPKVGERFRFTPPNPNEIGRGRRPGPEFGFGGDDTFAFGPLPRSQGPRRVDPLARGGLGQAPKEVALLLGAKPVSNTRPNPKDPQLVRVVYWNLGDYRHPDALDHYFARKDDTPAAERASANSRSSSKSSSKSKSKTKGSKSDQKQKREKDPLEGKTRRLAQGLLVAGAGRPPDFAFVSEIEGPELARRLAEHPKLKEAGYRVSSEQLDGYPMTHAILSRHPMVGTPKLHQVHEKDEAPTRGILEATFEVGGHHLTVFVNHWPSKRGGEGAADQREKVAEQLKHMIRERQALDPNAEILVVGDFNTFLEEAPFSEPYLNAVLDPEAVRNAPDGEKLFHTVADVAEEVLGRRFDSMDELGRLERSSALEIGTHFYKGTWNTLDGIIVNRGLLDGKGIEYVEGSAEVVRDDHFLFQGQKPDRNVSDHLPVAATLEVRGSDEPAALELRASSKRPRKLGRHRDRPKNRERPPVQVAISESGLPCPPIDPTRFEVLRGEAALKALRQAVQTRLSISPADIRNLCRGCAEPKAAHPFGVVQTADPTNPRVGRDARGRTVFEPRDADKPAVARAMLAAQAFLDFEPEPDELDVLARWAVLDHSGSNASEDPLVLRRQALREVQRHQNPFLRFPAKIETFS